MTLPAFDRLAARPDRAAAHAVMPPSGANRAGPVVSRLYELQRTAGNRAVRSMFASVQRAPGDGQQAAPPPPGTTGADQAAPERVTGFVGLNPGAGQEADRLRKVSKQKVLTSFNDPAMEKKLQEDPAIGEFLVKDLGWSLGDFPRMMLVMTMMGEADPNLREQLADVMRWMNKAEKGQVILERLVLSGHSDGVKLWGESDEKAESKPGIMIIERDLGALARIFPKATGQVEDIMFSACFSINAVEIVKKTFPNLRSVWSYGGYSPDSKHGSIDHIATWSLATEGDKAPTKREQRGSNALWTREKGYIVGDPAQAAAGPLITEASRGLNEWVKPYYKGDKEIDKATLDRFYTVLQQLQAHPGVDKETKDRITTNTIPVTLRLRHWRPIAEKFGKTYGDKLKPMYDAVGMQPPAWSTLTRVMLKQHLFAIEQAMEAKPDAAKFKPLLEDTFRKGLMGLDPKIIDESWI